VAAAAAAAAADAAVPHQPRDAMEQVDYAVERLGCTDDQQQPKQEALRKSVGCNASSNGSCPSPAEVGAAATDAARDTFEHLAAAQQAPALLQPASPAAQGGGSIRQPWASGMRRSSALTATPAHAAAEAAAACVAGTRLGSPQCTRLAVAGPAPRRAPAAASCRDSARSSSTGTNGGTLSSQASCDASQGSPRLQCRSASAGGLICTSSGTEVTQESAHEQWQAVSCGSSSTANWGVLPARPGSAELAAREAVGARGVGRRRSADSPRANTVEEAGQLQVWGAVACPTAGGDLGPCLLEGQPAKPASSQQVPAIHPGGESSARTCGDSARPDALPAQPQFIGRVSSSSDSLSAAHGGSLAQGARLAVAAAANGLGIHLPSTVLYTLPISPTLPSLQRASQGLPGAAMTEGSTVSSLKGSRAAMCGRGARPDACSAWPTSTVGTKLPPLSVAPAPMSARPTRPPATVAGLRRQQPGHAGHKALGRGTLAAGQAALPGSHRA
jgi:hypothetical protein